MEYILVQLESAMDSKYLFAHMLEGKVTLKNIGKLHHFMKPY